MKKLLIVSLSVCALFAQSDKANAYGFADTNDERIEKVEKELNELNNNLNDIKRQNEEKEADREYEIARKRVFGGLN